MRIMSAVPPPQLPPGGADHEEKRSSIERTSNFKPAQIPETLWPSCRSKFRLSTNKGGAFIRARYNKQVNQHLRKSVQEAVAAIKTCTQMKDLERGKQLHAELVVANLHANAYVASALIRMYSRCGRMELAQEVFDKLSPHDVLAWSSLLKGYVDNGKSLIALDLFTSVDLEPNHFTYRFALMACKELAKKKPAEKHQWLKRGMTIHKQLKEAGCHGNIFVENGLVDMYGTCGRMDLAKNVFDNMTLKDIFTWNNMIFGYVYCGNYTIAMDLFVAMDCEPDPVTCVAVAKACGDYGSQKGLKDSEKQLCVQKGIHIHQKAISAGFESDLILSTTLVNMYCKLGNIKLSKQIFDKMVHKNVIAWNALMLGFIENGESLKALEMLNHIDTKINVHTLQIAMKACAAVCATPIAKTIHAIACELGLDSQCEILISLINYYAKSGQPDTAMELFANIGSPTCALWSALIGGYMISSDVTTVFSEIHKMIETDKGMMDEITFIMLLNFCSRMGLIERGMYYFTLLPKYGITPNIEHYTCLVDMFARANNIESALCMIYDMPFKNNDVIAWTALLAACRKWKNVEIGRMAFDILQTISKSDGVSYVLMEDIYDSLNILEQKEMIESRRIQANALKVPGISYYCDAATCKVHEFKPGDIMNDQVMIEMNKILLGYLRQVRSSNCGHSEILALAFCTVL